MLLPRYVEHVTLTLLHIKTAGFVQFHWMSRVTLASPRPDKTCSFGVVVKSYNFCEEAAKETDAPSSRDVSIVCADARSVQLSRGHRYVYISPQQDNWV
jgi:hypothetical protein